MNHEGWMARAIKLARRGLYTTDPNPRVGCVLVREDRLVAEGWHRKAGEPHAERVALANAGEQARGATAYVTLEPCCHHGRTPPCSDALIAAGVERVVVAILDPNPLVAGQGIAQLREAGIEVITAQNGAQGMELLAEEEVKAWTIRIAEQAVRMLTAAPAPAATPARPPGPRPLDQRRVGARWSCRWSTPADSRHTSRGTPSGGCC